jgi:hypothetical protein
VSLRPATFVSPTSGDLITAAAYEQYGALYAGLYAEALARLTSTLASDDDRNLVHRYERWQSEQPAAAAVRAQYELGEAVADVAYDADNPAEPWRAVSSAPRPADLRASA